MSEARLSDTDVTILRSLISSSYSQPGILVHEDLQLLRDFFFHMGAPLDIPDATIHFDLLTPSSTSSTPLRPPVSPDKKIEIVFGEIRECEYDPLTKTITMKKYTLGNHVKEAVKSMILFLKSSSKSLISPNYEFIYDFLIHFGVLPARILQFIEIESSAYAKEQQERKNTEGADADVEMKEELEPVVNSEEMATLSEEEEEWQTEREGNPEENRQTTEIELKTPTINTVPKSEGKVLIECPSCDSPFARRSGMLHHFRKKHPEEKVPSSNRSLCNSKKNIICQLCSYSTSKMSAFRQHMAKQHAVPQSSVAPVALQSPPHGSSTTTKIDEVVIKNEVTSPPTSPEPGQSANIFLKCTICAHQVKSRSGLKYHWKTHHPEHGQLDFRVTSSGGNRIKVKNVKCNWCESAFVTESGLRYHMKTKHPGVQRGKVKGNKKDSTETRISTTSDPSSEIRPTSDDIKTENKFTIEEEIQHTVPNKTEPEEIPSFDDDDDFPGIGEYIDLPLLTDLDVLSALADT